MPEEAPFSAEASLEVVRVAFLGAFQVNRKASWVDEVRARAEVVFPSRAALRARRWLRERLREVPASKPVELRLVGYSWGGWTALQLTERLLRKPSHLGPAWVGRALQVRLGLLDPVDTWRREVRLPDDERLQAWNLYQRNGCFRGCPGSSMWYAGQPIENVVNWDVTLEGRDLPSQGGVPPDRAPDHLQLGYRAWRGHGVRMAGVLEGLTPEAPVHCAREGGASEPTSPENRAPSA